MLWELNETIYTKGLAHFLALCKHWSVRCYYFVVILLVVTSTNIVWVYAVKAKAGKGRTGLLHFFPRMYIFRGKYGTSCIHYQLILIRYRFIAPRVCHRLSGCWLAGFTSSFWLQEYEHGTACQTALPMMNFMKLMHVNCSKRPGGQNKGEIQVLYLEFTTS